VTGWDRGSEELLMALAVRLPPPFTRSDLRAGHVYKMAFRQFEVSDARVFDHPAARRAFLEGLTRDLLDVG
jgi:hypothetical protein